MWLAKCSTSSARWPVSRLTTPPGRSLVASTSANVTALSGCADRRERDDGIAADDRGDDRVETRPSRRASSGATIDDDAGRLEHAEVEVAAGDRVHAAEDLLIFVGPAGVVERARSMLSVDFVRALAEAATPLVTSSSTNCCAAAFEHLGDAIEDLPAVVRGLAGPARLALCGRRRRRRGNLSASSGRRWRAPRPCRSSAGNSGRTRCAGTFRRCRSCRS